MPFYGAWSEADKVSYKAGWNASKRGTTDLDTAEGRYRGAGDKFDYGWLDYAADHPYGWSMPGHKNYEKD